MLRPMRTPAISALAALLSFGLPASAATVTSTTKPSAASSTPVAAKAASAKSAASSTKPAAKPEAKEIVLPGVVIKRVNGGFASLDVVGTHFVLRFYDKDKKSVAPDATRASIRWQPKQKPRQMTSILNPSSDGNFLVGDKVVQPPLVFKVYITLFREGETVLESFQADYRDDGIEPEGK